MKYTYELNIQGKPIKNIIIEIKIIMFKVSESIINSFQQKSVTFHIDEKY